MLDCNIVISKFELQLLYYVHFIINTFGNDMNFLISTAIDSIVQLLFFRKVGFGPK